MRESQKFEKGFVKSEASSARDEIVLRAIEMQAFKDIILRTTDKIEAIREVRAMLMDEFPEVKDISREEASPDMNNRVVLVSHSKKLPGIPKPDPDFWIAKKIVDLLWQEKKK